MGQWATRQRRGGGPPTPPPLTQMSSSNAIGENEGVVAYNGPVTAANFTITDFQLDAGIITVVNISQNGPNGLLLEFDDDVESGGSLEYTGAVAGILTPQTITMNSL